MVRKNPPLAVSASHTRTLSLHLVVVLALIAGIALPASAAPGQFVAHNTPRYVSSAKNLGTEDPSKVIEVSIWLQPHNRVVDLCLDPLDALAGEHLHRPEIGILDALTSEADELVGATARRRRCRATRSTPTSASNSLTWRRLRRVRLAAGRRPKRRCRAAEDVR